MNFLSSRSRCPTAASNLWSGKRSSWQDAKFRVRGVTVSKPEMQEAKIKFVQKDLPPTALRSTFHSMRVPGARALQHDGKEANTTVLTTPIRSAGSTATLCGFGCLARTFPGSLSPHCRPEAVRQHRLLVRRGALRRLAKLPRAPGITLPVHGALQTVQPVHHQTR